MSKMKAATKSGSKAEGKPAKAAKPTRKASGTELSPAPAPKKRGKPPVDLGAALLRSFATNERIHQFLLEHLDPAIWTAEAPIGKGRTIRAIVAHIHNVRHMWLTIADAESPAPAKVDRHTLTLDEAKTALAASGRAILELVARSLEAGGHVKDFKPDVAGFVGYSIAHEAHHRGQICMLARMLGSPLPQTVAFGMWEWRKRGDEVEEQNESGAQAS